MTRLGDKLHLERRHKKLTLRDVSKETDLSPIYISEIETGKKIPLTGDALVKLAGFYGLDPAELVKMAFQDKADLSVKKGEESGQFAIARKKKHEETIAELKKE